MENLFLRLTFWKSENLLHDIIRKSECKLCKKTEWKLYVLYNRAVQKITFKENQKEPLFEINVEFKVVNPFAIKS